MQQKFIFNWSQDLDLMKAPCASSCKSVDITCGLAKEKSSNKKKISTILPPNERCIGMCI